MFIDCGIENHHSVLPTVGEFVRERYRKFCAPSVHRSLWTIVIRLFIINNIEINYHVEK